MSRSVVIFMGGLVLAITGSGCNDGAKQQATAIKQVLAKDKQISDWMEAEVKKGTHAPTVVRMAVGRMRKIDLTRCPSGFQQAYLKHVYAWSEMPPLLEKYDGVGGFFTSFLEGLTDRYDGDKEAKRIQKSIRETFLDVETVSLKYGVQQGH